MCVSWRSRDHSLHSRLCAYPSETKTERYVRENRCAEQSQRSEHGRRDSRLGRSHTQHNTLKKHALTLSSTCPLVLPAPAPCSYDPFSVQTQSLSYSEPCASLSHIWLRQSKEGRLARPLQNTGWRGLARPRRMKSTPYKALMATSRLLVDVGTAAGATQRRGRREEHRACRSHVVAPNDRTRQTPPSTV